MFSLDKKIVVVCGGLGLIGKEVVKAVIEQGAYAIIADVDKDKGSRFLDELDNSNVDYMDIDITNEKNVLRFIDDVEKNYGPIWAWVNLAYPRTDDWGDKLEDIKIESFAKNVDLQLNSQFICCRAILEKMKERNEGVVVNCSSIYGMQGPNFHLYDGTAMTTPAAYSAIKAGIVNLTKYFAAYYGEYNLRINCIAPGGIFDNQNPVFVKNYNNMTPLGRMGNADEIAPGVVFLISKEASYITGQTLVIDGGFTIW